jgi:hypothetical protein
MTGSRRHPHSHRPSAARGKQKGCRLEITGQGYTVARREKETVTTRLAHFTRRVRANGTLASSANQRGQALH